MTFLPIVERELRVAARRRSTYFGRLAGALIAMAVGGWLLMVTYRQPSNQIGQALFIALSVMLFIYSIAAGARITADCLSEEKREGTLGLLFLTDLKGYDIVSGKLVANSLNTFYGLLAAFPVLAISLLMGGVTSGEFWRVSLVATNLLFFSLAVGMFASAVCRDERKALSLAFFILFVMLAATPAVEFGLNIADRNRAQSTVWLIPSPGFACFTAFGSRLGFKAAEFWTTVVLTHGYAWIFLVLASSVVPRAWQDKTATAPLRLRGILKIFLKSKSQNRDTTRRTRLLEINPFLWLAARDSMKTIFLWTTLFTLSALWLWAAIKWPKDWISIPSYIFAAVVLHTVLKIWLASEACFRFVEDRKSGALELLLSTPLSVSDILRGQRLALLRQFIGPASYVVIVDVIFMTLGLSDDDLNRSDERSFWIMLWGFGISIFVMDLFALSWVSMWAGLTSKQANRAANSASARILVLPWMVFFLFMTMIAMGSGLRSGMDGETILVLWFVIALINNFVFAIWAKNNLHERLREVATQRFAQKTSWFGAIKSGDELKPELPPVIQ